MPTHTTHRRQATCGLAAPMVTLLAAVLATVLMVSGCGAGNTRLDVGKGLSLTEAEFRYGVAPEPDSDITLAEDVVVVGGGAQSVKSVSGDGLVWTIDARAPRADQLEIGKVFFITNRGVGRVYHLERDGRELTVVIGPVDITEVITEGDFGAENIPIPLEDLMFHDTGELAWSVTEPAAEAVAESDATGDDAPGGQGSGAAAGSMTGRLPLASLAQQPSPSPGGGRAPGEDTEGDEPGGDAPGDRHPAPTDYVPPPPPPLPTWGGADWVQVGDFAIKPRSPAGVELGYRQRDLSVNALIGLYGLPVPEVTWRLKIANAAVQEATVNITGVTGFTYRVDIRTGPGYEGHNLVRQITLPVSASIPLPSPSGITFNLEITQALQVRVGTSAKNSWMTADGSWTFAGGVGFGYRDGTFGAHTVDDPRTNQSLLRSVRGASPAVQSAVLAHEVRFMVGIGWHIFSVGPYTKVTTSMGMTRSSDLAGPLAGGVGCVSGALNMWLSFGIGYTLPRVVVEVLNFILRTFGARTIAASGSIAEFTVRIFERDGQHCQR